MNSSLDHPIPTPPPEPNAAAAAARPLLLLAHRDDERRAAAAHRLAQGDFEVIVTADGGAALELFSEMRPAVVVAEMALRDRRGRSLCAAIREMPRGGDVPVLALCAADREVRGSVEAGVTDFLRLPVDWNVATLRASQLARRGAPPAAGPAPGDQAAVAGPAPDSPPAAPAPGQGPDPSGGLADRRRFERLVDRALAGTASASRPLAVALFEVDRFAWVAAAVGLTAAAALRSQVAGRLAGSVRSPHLFGGDAAGPAMAVAAELDGGHFAALLCGLSRPSHVAKAVRQLADALSATPYSLPGGGEQAVSVSCGVAVAPQDGTRCEHLLPRAEIALREAADLGGGLVRFHRAPAPGERSDTLRSLLPHALERNELRLVYQPLVEGPERRVTSVEALLRWDSAELGPVGPAEFIPVAEESGQIIPIGTWVLREACRQLRRWLDDGIAPMRMAVNIARAQIVRGDLHRLTAEILAETGVAPDLLELELSERGALRSDPLIHQQLCALKAVGVRLAIDDFGTGNSAIAYLKRFPLDVVKIDQSFIRGLGRSSDDAAITTATISMARQLRLQVVADGVEESPQLDFLQSQGCTVFQGFLFSPPLAPDDLRRFLARPTEISTPGGDSAPPSAPEEKS